MNFEACRKEKLSPLTWYLNVYEKPDVNLKSIGKIQIIGTPGKGLQAQYMATGKEGDLDLRPKPRPLNKESVYLAGSLRNIVFTKFSGNEFSYRKENANDMSCDGESKKISSLELKELTKPISILFDKDGHLIAWPAYCRGC